MLVVAVMTIFAVGINRLVVADDQCSSYEFESSFYPGKSCEDIYNKNPQSRDKSGYYWITDGLSNVYCGMTYTGLSCEHIYNNNRETGNNNGYYPINNNQWTFCNMTAIAAHYFTFSCAGVGGEWKRIASLDISAGDDCPSGWNRSSYSDVNFCRSPSNNSSCYSANFSTNHVGYQRVCGRARGYQKGSTGAFLQGGSLDSFYVDGLSITHGSPRQHIFTYAAGVSESANNAPSRCPCASPLGTPPPSFVGFNYYCESGVEGGNDIESSIYYLSDPLWDGSGCSSGNNCCSNNTLPWFQNQLIQITTDDIEVRICSNEAFSNEGVLIDFLELYVQ